LIVATILLLFAALGLDWDEIRGTYGGASLQFLRRGLGSVEEVIERVAASDEVSEPARRDLEAARDQVKALTPPERTSRRSQAYGGGVDAMFREFNDDESDPRFQGPGCRPAIAENSRAS
jgi:hypothetical protein